MVPKEVEMILARQLASFLALPIFLVGIDGGLIYYNEPAETILGCRFEEPGHFRCDAILLLNRAFPNNRDAPSRNKRSLLLIHAGTTQLPEA